MLATVPVANAQKNASQAIATQTTVEYRAMATVSFFMAPGWLTLEASLFAARLKSRIKLSDGSASSSDAPAYPPAPLGGNELASGRLFLPDRSPLAWASSLSLSPYRASIRGALAHEEQ